MYYVSHLCTLPLSSIGNCVFAHSLLSQLVARGGISVSAIINYKLTPELSTKACFINRVRVRNCIGIYNQWTNNKIVLDVWYQFRKVKWCKKWGVPYVSYYAQTNKSSHYFLLV